MLVPVENLKSWSMAVLSLTCPVRGVMTERPLYAPHLPRPRHGAVSPLRYPRRDPPLLIQAGWADLPPVASMLVPETYAELRPRTRERAMGAKRTAYDALLGRPEHAGGGSWATAHRAPGASRTDSRSHPLPNL